MGVMAAQVEREEKVVLVPPEQYTAKAVTEVWVGMLVMGPMVAMGDHSLFNIQQN